MTSQQVEKELRKIEEIAQRIVQESTSQTKHVALNTRNGLMHY